MTQEEIDFEAEQDRQVQVALEERARSGRYKNVRDRFRKRQDN